LLNNFVTIKGKIRCIGNSEHLKMKFGNSYILAIYTKDIERFHYEVVVGRNLFSDNKYEKEVKLSQRIKYEVQSKSNISGVFDIMEKLRKEGLFIDYSYSQTSLEQIFLNNVDKFDESEN